MNFIFSFKKYASPRFILPAIVIFASLLWSYKLGEKSFWTDEVLSIFHARQMDTMGSLLTMHFNNAHPPAYFLLLRLWLSFFNDAEAASRFLSVILAIPAIIFIYLTGKRLIGTGAGLLAAFLYSIMPLMLIYNRELRMYSMFVTLSCAALYALLKAVDEDTKKNWAFFSLIAFFMCVTHYHGFLVLTAQGLFILFQAMKKPDSKHLLVRFILYLGLVMLLFSFFIPGLVAARRTFGIMWQPGAKSTVVSIGYLCFSLLLGQTIMPWDPAAISGAAAILVLCIGGACKSRSNRFLCPLLLSYALLVFGIGPVISHTMPRYYLFFVPLLCIWLAAGILFFRPRFISLPAAILLLMSWAASDMNYYAGKDFHVMATVDPWRETAVFLRDASAKDDKIIVPFTQSLNLYYLPRYGLKDRTITDISGFQTDGRLPQTVWLVVANPSAALAGENIRKTLVDGYGYSVVNMERFLRDPNYALKRRFFTKIFAEYRIEVLKLCRRAALDA